MEPEKGRMFSMGQLGSDRTGRVATTVVGGVIAAPFSYMFGKIIEKWGILDPLADQIGEWLKVHVPAEAVSWTVGLLVFAALYGFLLWKVWRPRHIHHGELSITAGSASLAGEASRTPTGAKRKTEAEPLNRFFPPTVTQGPPRKARDTRIAAALGYALNGDWETPVGSSVLLVGSMSALDNAIETFRQAAESGKLRTWGRTAEGGLIQVIDRNFWSDNTLDRSSIFGFFGGLAKTVPLDDGAADESFCDIRVNRAEVERIWPHA
jgi:hypothetical protein